MVISSVLVAIISGGIGYLLVQWRPAWFGGQFSQSFMRVGWIAALLLAGAMRAVLVVYGAEATLAVTGVIVGFIIGIWLARRGAQSAR